MSLSVWDHTDVAEEKKHNDKEFSWREHTAGLRALSIYLVVLFNHEWTKNGIQYKA